MKDPHNTLNFIQQIITDDLEAGRVSNVVTRFPPEPNGFLHIGHAKSICLNFGLAEQFGGTCNLRFDDTNPEKEDQVFVDAIIEDVRWLGFDWPGEPCYASDYFDQLYAWAVYLVEQNKAYVCELNAEKMREYRGSLTSPGQNSPFRDRPISENLVMLESMRSGEMDEGSMTLRAKIDMASPNINMRDPVLYRIKKMSHQRTGDKWNIYPSYDFAHGQEDAIEGVSHSVCTLEFAANRPLYDWFIDNLPVPSNPHQYEFGRLNLNYTVTSKRKLKSLVDEAHVSSWDDPRMPSISGLRRRGVSAKAIRSFCDSLAVAKTDGVVDVAQFEHFIRDDLNVSAKRAMCVLQPLLIRLTNHQDAKSKVTVANHPNNQDVGSREVAFGETLYIDRSDFSEDTSLSRKKFKRLVIGDYVRLRGAYIIRADEVIRDADDHIIEVVASLVPDTVGKDAPEGIKPRGVIHWVDAESAVDCDVNLYDRLFSVPDPGAGGMDFRQHLNPHSLVVIKHCKAEASLRDAVAGEHYQFEREGYFTRDSSNSDNLIFNCTIGLRDNWKAQND
ncbi:glutamine--tRNA ligase/YqeY domain fusion protein [Porticoccaceae bacterium]|nr:glutamine--tRNA ligase/YqeY domain fusion protein [Porticoccaceae bacterium]MDB2664203.1 glutamine--tRNA ligase/YqeY domain fusion protein [Porticoccaceae bacterium]